MKNASGFAQLYLRMAMGIGFILPVLDRTGFLGPFGAPNVSWGDWSHFIKYTNTLMPYFNHAIANIFGFLATVAELTFGICLVLGIKVRVIVLGAAILTFTFGMSMAIFVGIAAPFMYPVFVFTGAALVLSCVGRYKWSFDEFQVRKSR